MGVDVFEVLLYMVEGRIGSDNSLSLSVGPSQKEPWQGCMESDQLYMYSFRRSSLHPSGASSQEASSRAFARAVQRLRV